MAQGLPLDRFPVHLGLGARACAEPGFDGAAWYEAYANRHADDGAEGRVVAIHHYHASWDNWEMHPGGDEVVVCLSGEILLHREAADGAADTVMLVAGAYAINPAGAWHTADIAGPASALFITAGWGTQHGARTGLAG